MLKRIYLITIIPLPILLAAAWGWFTFALYPEGFNSSPGTENFAEIFGVRTVHWVFILSVAVPLFVALWMFITTGWKRPLIVAGLFYYGVLFAAAAGYIPDETTPVGKKILHLGFFSPGTEVDVYCNGHYLGKGSQTFRVEDVLGKVPEWTTPPEQNLYAEISQRYEYVPFDDFRSEEQQTLADEIKDDFAKAPAAAAENIVQYQKNCRYWWSFERKIGDEKYKLFAVRDFKDASYYVNTSNINKQTAYFSSIWTYYRPAPLLGYLLAEVEPGLTDADRVKCFEYAKKYKASGRLSENDDYTRYVMGLSNPATADECRKFLQDWRKENGEWSWSHFCTYSGERGIRDEHIFMDDEVLSLMKESMPQVVAEEWKSTCCYNMPTYFAPLIYFTAKGHYADSFDALVRYSAATGGWRSFLFEMHDERVVPIYKNRLYRRSYAQLFNGGMWADAEKIDTFGSVYNPLTEEIFWGYVAKQLSKPNLQKMQQKELERSVGTAVFERLRILDSQRFAANGVEVNFNKVDAAALTKRVEALPLSSDVKQYYLKRLALAVGEPETFAEMLQLCGGVEVTFETTLTLDDVNKWFAENPNKSSESFLIAMQKEGKLKIKTDNDHRKSYFYTGGQAGDVTRLTKGLFDALLKWDTPESRKTVEALWENAAKGDQIGLLTAFQDKIQGQQTGAIAAELPDWFLDLLQTAEEKGVAGLLFGRDEGLNYHLEDGVSPKIGEMLTKWSKSENRRLAADAADALRNWNFHRELENNKKQWFADLIAGKITPDDLLPPEPKWTWTDSGYQVKK
ncbi:hypothetical protein FACS189419_03710 [Planctomycetales bacterium]|nr:hypothetical protein FACS189419_03710 [Planctomycetales bacterium]